jgi:hypothetical protein
MLNKCLAFFNRLKPWAKIALIAAIIVLLGIGACRIVRGSVSHRIAIVEAKLAVAEQQTKDADKAFQAAEKARKDAINNAILQIAAADKKLADLARKDAQISKDLEAEKAKTKALTSDALASSLGTYIGAQNIFATASIPSTFVLTRDGAENTRGIFLTSTAIAEKLTNCDAAREQDGIKLVSMASELGSTANALGACKGSLLTNEEVITQLKKDVALWKAKNRWVWLKAGLPAVAVGVVAGYLLFHSK